MRDLTGLFKVALVGAAASLALVGLFLGVSYFASAPRSGTVEAAWLTPAHSERYQSGTTCFSYDPKSGWCNLSLPIYSERWVPDTCHVTLNDAAASHRKWTWTVSCADLASFRVGQYGAVK